MILYRLLELLALGAGATVVWYGLFSGFHKAIEWLDERHNG